MDVIGNLADFLDEYSVQQSRWAPPSISVDPAAVVLACALVVATGLAILLFPITAATA